MHSSHHGHAVALSVIGGDVKGRKVYGQWPGLEPEQSYDGRDLALTTVFCSVFAEVVSRHPGATRIDTHFPGHDTRASSWLGLL